MRIESAFEVPAGVATAWALLLDVPRVIPCMPGAELVEQVDDSTWKAKMAVKLGPISLSFATNVTREETDEAARRIRLSANAREVRGRGAAQVAIESTLTPIDDGTRVNVATELNLSGAVAQYGRGIVQDVTAQLIDQFAACLAAQLNAATPAAAAAAVDARPRPVGGIRLLLRALLRRFRLRRTADEAGGAG